MEHVAVGHRYGLVGLIGYVSSTLCVASVCLVLFIRIKAGNSRIKLCRNFVFCADHIKPGLRHIIRRVMAWWNVLIGIC